MTTKEKIEVMQAEDEGKPLQFRDTQIQDHKWEDLNHKCALWNWERNEFRIKPIEPNDYQHGDVWSNDGDCTILIATYGETMFYTSASCVHEWRKVEGNLTLHPERFKLLFRENGICDMCGGGLTEGSCTNLDCVPF